MAETERLICERAQLVDGGAAARFTIEFDGQPLQAFVIAFDGNVHAYVNRCPHQGTELDWQPGQMFDDSGLYLVCATHGALFQPDSGRCVGGPCQGATLVKIAVDEIDNRVHLRAGRLVSTSPPPNVSPP